MINASFFLDPLMDICLLAAAQLSLSRLNLRRLLAGYLILAFYTLLYQALCFPSLLHIPALLLAAAAATNERRPGRILEAAFCAGCAAIAAAGFASLPGGCKWLAPLGAVFTAMILRRRRHISHRWDIELEARLNGETYCFPALIDTGNRLHEPTSGLPVLIAEEAIFPGITAYLEQLACDELRHLPYGVLGGAGEIICLKPESLHIIFPEFGEISAPECWLGIFPGKIPGHTRALAPPEFADAMQNPVLPRKHDNNCVRRFVHHVIFKRKAIHLRYGGADSQGFGVLHRRQRSASAAADPRGGS